MSAERNLHNRDLLFSILALDQIASGASNVGAALAVGEIVQGLHPPRRDPIL